MISAAKSSTGSMALPQHLKLFERLYYASIVLDVMSAAAAYLADHTTAREERIWQLAAIVILSGVAAVLVWAAARRAKRWAVWLLAIYVVIGIYTCLADFADFLPRSMSFLKPENPPTMAERVLDPISTILAITAISYYFFQSNPLMSATSYGQRPTPTGAPDEFKLRIYTGGLAGPKTAETRAIELMNAFKSEAGYSSYEITAREERWFPSCYDYTIRFVR
jgi:hypothetical protein